MWTRRRHGERGHWHVRGCGWRKEHDRLGSVKQPTSGIPIDRKACSLRLPTLSLQVVSPLHYVSAELLLPYHLPATWGPAIAPFDAHRGSPPGVLVLTRLEADLKLVQVYGRAQEQAKK